MEYLAKPLKECDIVSLEVYKAIYNNSQNINNVKYIISSGMVDTLILKAENPKDKNDTTR